MEKATRKLGPYTLVSKIGRGAFGVVWLAEKKSSIATTRFALKLPRDEDIDIEAFKQEATIWLQASGHPNVVPMIEADIYDEQVVIVSEYVPDGSLGAWLKQHGGRAPSIEAACEIIEGVLSGLTHLHGRHIIHRDLKPDNILLQQDTPRLADFGIARLLKTGSYSANVSGTFAYMAPEAFDGKRNEQTDVWSAGVIFYQLLAGRLPYDQEDTPSFIGAIMRHDPPPLPESVPEVLRQVVTKALRREPSERYATAKEMRRDLLEAERLLWLTEREAREALSAKVEDPQATLVLPKTEEMKASPAPAIKPQPTIRATPQRETDRAAEKTIPQASFPMGQPTVPTFDTPHKEDHAASSPVNPVKGKSHSLLWLAGLGGVGVLLLGILSLAGIYYWISSRAANKEHPSTLAATKQPLGPYALKQTLTEHDGWVDSVAFSPDGKMFASGSTDETIKLWDAESGALKQTLPGKDGIIYSVAFSPDGKTLAFGRAESGYRSNNTDYNRYFMTVLWDLQKGQATQTLPQGKTTIYSSVPIIVALAFSPDSKTIASGSWVEKIKLWDVQSGQLKLTLTGPEEYILTVAFSPDGKTLASGSDDKTIKLWDVQSGQLKQTLAGHSNSVNSVAFASDGKTLASASSDKTIKLWDVQSGQVRQTLSGADSGVLSVAFSPDGKTLASGGYDKTINLWDLQSGQLKQTLSGHSGPIESIAFSPDGKTLASGSQDKTIKLWRVQTSGSDKNESPAAKTVPRAP